MMMQALQVVAVIIGILTPPTAAIMLWISRVNTRLTRIETLLETRNETHHAH